MKIEFSKMHGAGNDYVYVDCTRQDLPAMGAISEYVSRRRFSIGSDGLICICPSDVADFRMRMFNADRSEGKMCGNGIRCVAKFVYDKGLTDKTRIRIETLAGIKEIDVDVQDGKVVLATVDMGEPILACPQIPMSAAGAQFIDQELVLPNGQAFRGTAVSMGNPHFVTFVDDVDSLDLEAIGPLFEHHPRFPEGVNTEFVQVLNARTVKFRVWERGSGETWACGTGACAVGVTCNMLGRAGQRGEPLSVHCRGGELKITHAEDGHVFMQGGAVEAFTGTIEVPDEVVFG